MDEHPDISEDRMLSEIGMLFVEGFETTGALLGTRGRRRARAGADERALGPRWAEVARGGALG
jgi:hypothetical protein